MSKSEYVRERPAAAGLQQHRHRRHRRRSRTPEQRDRREPVRRPAHRRPRRGRGCHDLRVRLRRTLRPPGRRPLGRRLDRLGQPGEQRRAHPVPAMQRWQRDGHLRLDHDRRERGHEDPVERPALLAAVDQLGHPAPVRHRRARRHRGLTDGLHQVRRRQRGQAPLLDVAQDDLADECRAAVVRRLDVGRCPACQLLRDDAAGGRRTRRQPWHPPLARREASPSIFWRSSPSVQPARWRRRPRSCSVITSSITRSSTATRPTPGAG